MDGNGIDYRAVLVDLKQKQTKLKAAIASREIDRR